jgi:hypothetical protein
MNLLSFNLSGCGAAKILCFLMAVVLAFQAPHAGSRWAEEPEPSAQNVTAIVPASVFADGFQELPSRQGPVETPLPLTDGSVDVGSHLLPHTVLLRSGTTPSAAPHRRLLVTQWNSSSS